MIIIFCPNLNFTRSQYLMCVERLDRIERLFGVKDVIGTSREVTKRSGQHQLDTQIDSKSDVASHYRVSF